MAEGIGSKWADGEEDRGGEPEVAEAVDVPDSLDVGTEHVQHRTLP